MKLQCGPEEVKKVFHVVSTIRRNSLSAFSFANVHFGQTVNALRRDCGRSPLETLLLAPFPRCSTYVAIDQAPVSVCHICAQTSVALIWLTVTDDHASEGWWRWWMNECVTVSFTLSLSAKLLLNHSISTVFPVVQNTLLWLNKPTHHTHSPLSLGFYILSLSCTCLRHSLHVLFSLACVIHKSGSLQSWHSTTSLSWRKNTQKGEESTGRNIYSFCLQQTGWAPCSASLWL